MTQQQDSYKTLVSSQQLQMHLQDKHWMIFDCRFDLMNPAAGEKAYQQGHIPGAFYLHLEQDLSSAITPESGRHPLPDMTILAQKLRKLGVGQKTQVIAYDDMGGATAARLWWLLRRMSHEAVAVLDGGIQAWRAQGLELEQVISQAGKTGDFQPQLRADETVNADQLIPPNDWQVVDARASERFRGEAEPIDPVAGHIPGAVNRPLSDNLQAGQFKPAAVLREEWLALLAGREPQTIVHQCGSGITACHNQLAMEIAGLPGSRIYPGSWSEWIRDTKRPVAVGA